MARNYLSDFFHYNQAAKLGSFLAAVSLWLFAVSGATRTGLFPGTIPLALANQPDSLIATANVESVRVRLAADPTVWRQLTSTAISADVDLAGQTAGLTELPVKLTVTVPNVQVVEVIPKVVQVQLERRATVERRVDVTTTGEPASGLFASEASVDPATVTITGGQSVIDRVDRIAAVVDIAGASADRDQTVSVQPLDAAGHTITGITSRPATVRVHQPLTKLAASKTVGVRVLTTGAPPDGKLVTPVSTQPATVTITGSGAQLASITTLATKPIDLAAISQRTTVRASLDVPAGVSLVTSAVVEVTVDVMDHDASVGVSPKVVVTGLSDDRRVATVEPATPTVVVRGSASALATLSTSDVTLSIDLTGQGVGPHKVELIPSQLHLPDGISLQQLITTSLTITVQ